MNKTTITWCHGMSVPCDECDGLGETVVGREVEAHQSRLFPRSPIEECQPCKGLGKIPRQGYTWNPTRGCSPESTGCLNCYAGTLATRFSGEVGVFEGYAERHRTGRGGAAWTGKVDLLPEKLADPLRVRMPGAIFVNSMSDLFHEELTFEEIAAVVGVMAATPWHLHMTLTKRASRMREWFEWIESAAPFEAAGCHKMSCRHSEEVERHMKRHPWKRAEWPLPNWRIGVSAEDQQRWDERVPELLRCPAAFRFTSCEPLLSPIDVSKYVYDREQEIRNCARAPWCMNEDQADSVLVGVVDQIIVGSESGHGARPMDLDWARSIRDQCQAAGCAFFMKQISTEKGVGCSGVIRPGILLGNSLFGSLEGFRDQLRGVVL